jgi:hypothetical protein
MSKLSFSIALILVAVGCETGSLQAGEEGPKASETTKSSAERRQSAMLTDVDLDKHKWEERVILLFAPSSDHADYQKMRDDLGGREEGVEQRDLVIYHLFFEEPGRVGEREVAVSATEQSAPEYGADEGGFTYVLIGKDGTQKMREKEAVSVDEIFATIDRMPMRQREMRE